jgi:hypothetical protein
MSDSRDQGSTSVGWQRKSVNWAANFKGRGSKQGAKGASRNERIFIFETVPGEHFV